MGSQISKAEYLWLVGPTIPGLSSLSRRRLRPCPPPSALCQKTVTQSLGARPGLALSRTPAQLRNVATYLDIRDVSDFRLDRGPRTNTGVHKSSTHLRHDVSHQITPPSHQLHSPRLLLKRHDIPGDEVRGHLPQCLFRHRVRMRVHVSRELGNIPHGAVASLQRL